MVKKMLSQFQPNRAIYCIAYLCILLTVAKNNVKSIQSVIRTMIMSLEEILNTAKGML